MNDYGRELAELVAILDGAGAVASVRGDGSARFVYAVRDPRAVEISCDADGWWVEFWEGDSVVSDRTFSVSRAAALSARSWLEVEGKLRGE